MSSILNTSVSALNAFRRNMETTGHNIANVNTEGYHRQVVELTTRPPQGYGFGFIGSGVQVASIERQYDQYLVERIRTFNSAEQEWEIYHSRASQVDGIVMDSAAGIDVAMQNFFDSLQDMADDPSSVPAREVVLSEAEMMVSRFQAMDGWLHDLRNQMHTDMESFARDVNDLTRAIANINGKIQEEQAKYSDQPPNDLLDQRDHLIDQLSQLVSITTVPQDDGAINVFIGKGQAVVMGVNTFEMSIANSPEAADHKEILLSQPGGSVITVTDQVTGGRIGGIFRFRDEVLDPAQNALGRLALTLASYFNAEHQTGMDLDGDLGGDLFRLATPQVLGNPANTGSVSVAFGSLADLQNLTTAEYTLSFDGANGTLVNQSTGQVTTLVGAGPHLVDGLSIDLSTAAAGDSYRLRPTRTGAFELGLLVANVRDVAAADPVIPSAAAANTGTAAISDGSLVTRTGSTKLAAPVTLTYDTANGWFNISTGGTLAYNPATQSGSTLSLSLAGLGDFEFVMTGAPANGDVFTLADNTGGKGDNRNALRLADLQNFKGMEQGEATFNDAYSYLVADVAIQTRQGQTNMEVQQHLLNEAEKAHNDIAGVNLDEEAANLLQFQQAYQAAAQVISTANQLFDVLLGVVRR